MWICGCVYTCVHEHKWRSKEPCCLREGLSLVWNLRSGLGQPASSRDLPVSVSSALGF